MAMKVVRKNTLMSEKNKEKDDRRLIDSIIQRHETKIIDKAIVIIGSQCKKQWMWRHKCQECLYLDIEMQKIVSKLKVSWKKLCNKRTKMKIEQ